MAAHDLREFLALAEARGLLKRVAGLADCSWEPGCLVKWMYHGLPMAQRFGLRFDQLSGSAFPLVTAALGASVDSYALALGVAPEEVNEHWVRALLEPRAPVRVATAPCQEVVLTGAHATLDILADTGMDAGP